MMLSCKCKNFLIDWNTQAVTLTARICGCNYCSNQKAEYLSDNRSTIKFTVADESKRKIIQHGHSTADFHECESCGLIMVTSKIRDKKYCVLNGKALDVIQYKIDRQIKNFENESIQERLSRREKNWCMIQS